MILISVMARICGCARVYCQGSRITVSLCVYLPLKKQFDYHVKTVICVLQNWLLRRWSVIVHSYKKYKTRHMVTHLLFYGIFGLVQCNSLQYCIIPFSFLLLLLLIHSAYACKVFLQTFACLSLYQVNNFKILVFFPREVLKRSKRSPTGTVSNGTLHIVLLTWQRALNIPQIKYVLHI